VVVHRGTARRAGDLWGRIQRDFVTTRAQHSAHPRQLVEELLDAPGQRAVEQLS
jgi:hypothetical protein